MASELRCLICDQPLPANRSKFCCHKHAMKWHNSRSPWKERKDRHRKNAARKAAYRADPEFWRNKARKWREDHPERAQFFTDQGKIRYWNSPWLKLVIAARSRAKKRKLAFNLTADWGEKRWTGFCEITKIPFAPRRGASSSIFSPSIDRIIPTKGYTQDNCRFVLIGVNGLKHDGTDDAMYFVAEAIIKNHPFQNCAPNNPYPQKPDELLADTMS